jgi:hypothetical protein
MHNLKTVLILAVAFIGNAAFGQSGVTVVPAVLQTDDSAAALRVGKCIDTLLSSIRKGQIDSSLIEDTDKDISMSFFLSFDSMMLGAPAKMINFYPIGERKYLCWVSFEDSSGLLAIVDFLASLGDGGVRLGTPLPWLTRHWRRMDLATVTYHFDGKFDRQAALAFDRKNRAIASWLGLRPTHLDFYLTANYQEIKHLFGMEYNVQSVGLARYGYFIDTTGIFAIQGNEDFSHDIVHFYSSKFRGKVRRNAAADEGLAYWWGNAYYTDAKGQMISLGVLASDLRRYLAQHQEASFWELFSKNPKILTKRAGEVSVRAVISGIILAEVEKKKGIPGIRQVLLCGPGDDAFLGAIDQLIGIDKKNFDSKVRALAISFP